MLQRDTNTGRNLSPEPQPGDRAYLDPTLPISDRVALFKRYVTDQAVKIEHSANRAHIDTITKLNSELQVLGEARRWNNDEVIRHFIQDRELLEIIFSDSPMVLLHERLSAAKELQGTTERGTIDILLTRGIFHVSSVMRQASSVALQGTTDSETITWLRTLGLTHRRDEVRVASAHALSGTPDSLARESLWRVGLVDQISLVRATSAIALTGITETECVRALGNTLGSDTNSLVRVASAQALLETPSALGRSALVQSLLLDPTPEVREASALALCRSNDPEAIAALTQALFDRRQDRSVRVASARSLVSSADSESISLLLDVGLNDDRDEVRGAVVQALYGTKEEHCIKALLKILLYDTSHSVKQLAGESLAHLPNHPLLRGAFRTLPSNLI